MWKRSPGGEREHALPHEVVHSKAEQVLHLLLQSGVFAGSIERALQDTQHVILGGEICLLPKAGVACGSDQRQHAQHQRDRQREVAM